MNEFFKSLYEVVYSGRFLDILGELVSEENETVLFTGNFAWIGIVAIVISFLIAYAFYIWPIDHPRFKAWWAWLIMLLLNGTICFFEAIGFASARVSAIDSTLSIDEEDLWEGLLNSSLPEETSNTMLADSLSISQYIDFAFANVFWACAAFILASLIFNWFSVNCKFSPFRK